MQIKFKSNYTIIPKIMNFLMLEVAKKSIAFTCDGYMNRPETVLKSMNNVIGPL